MGPYDIILCNMKAREAHENEKKIFAIILLRRKMNLAVFSTLTTIRTLLFKKFFLIPTNLSFASIGFAIQIGIFILLKTNFRLSLEA